MLSLCHEIRRGEAFIVNQDRETLVKVVLVLKIVTRSVSSPTCGSKVKGGSRRSGWNREVDVWCKWSLILLIEHP